MESVPISSGTSGGAAPNRDATPNRAPAAGASPAGIVFQGNVYGVERDAEENRSEALRLAESQFSLCLVPVGPPDDSKCLLPKQDRKALEHLARQRVDPARSVLYHAGGPTLWNLDYYGRCRVGRTGFCTDRIPDGWADRCNAMDEVWVPSQFNFETFIASGVDRKRLRVMRPGVNTELLRPGQQPLDLPERRGFNFLSISDLQPGQGTDLLLRAYLQEFKPDEDVALILKIDRQRNSRGNPEAELAYFVERQVGIPLEQSAPLILLDGAFSGPEMERLYSSAHAFVLATHGKAFGRSLLEALAAGLPIITTRWGGPLDFLNDENSYLIDFTARVPASPADEFTAGHLWAEPNVEHLRQLMREVYSNPKQAQERARQGREDAVSKWDWNAVMPEWVREFHRLLA